MTNEKLSEKWHYSSDFRNSRKNVYYSLQYSPNITIVQKYKNEELQLSPTVIIT